MSAAVQRQAGSDLVVFWLARNMAYKTRMMLAFGLILLGVLLQWYSGEVFAGVIPLVAGNALLLVKGYDNRVEFKGYDPAQQWQQVEPVRLAELKALDRKIKRWDRSFMDVTNSWGLITFFLLIFLLFLMFAKLSAPGQPSRLLAIPIDMAILFLPHWFTGTRRILRMPGLLIKAELLDKVRKWAEQEFPKVKAEVLMLLKGKEKTLPADIKIKLAPKDAPKDFLGLYGQVVINNVQGKSYPYFYMVLVAQPKLGLKALAQAFDPPTGVVREFKEQNGVEVLVIRQHTTRRSGYHTKPERVRQLFELGMEQMRRLL